MNCVPIRQSQAARVDDLGLPLRPSRLAALVGHMGLDLGQSQLGDVLGEFLQALVFVDP